MLTIVLNLIWMKFFCKVLFKISFLYKTNPHKSVDKEGMMLESFFIFGFIFCFCFLKAEALFFLL